MVDLTTYLKWSGKEQRHKKDYRKSTGYRRKTKVQFMLIDISEENRTDGTEIISII